MEFNKGLLLIVSFFSLFLSSIAVPSTFLMDKVIQTSQIAPSPAPRADVLSVLDDILSVLRDAPSMAPSPNVSELSDGIGTGALDHLKAAVVGNAINDAISHLCKDAENITLCVNTIVPYMNGQDDPVKAVNIETDNLFNQTQKVVGIIVKLITDNGGRDKNLADTLSVCKENYEGNLDDIKSALEAIKKEDIGRAQSMLSGVISSLETCKDAFGESGLEFPFPDDSNKVYQLAGNCLGILNLIHF